ncbi:unnamed protein product [Rhizophagus irregularis]|nr:unnamed protein product [Rhizophagus irregularis]
MSNYERCEKCDNYLFSYMRSWCIRCQIKSFKENFINWTSGNEKIDKFIQGRQLRIPRDIIFEWIPYNHFYNIEEVGKHDASTVYLVSWKNGPLYWNKDNKKYIRKSPDKKVILKCLHNLHGNIIDEFLNEINEIFKSSTIRCSVYGISQNPDTKDYIMVLDIEYFECYCMKCGKVYTKRNRKWCKQCQINNFKEKFANWTSKNDKIDKFIQGRQLKIDYYSYIIFEWIPYNHFYNIKEVGKHDVNRVYLALWENGPLYWNEDNKKYLRTSPDKKVILKSLHNLHGNIIDEFLNEINEIFKSSTIRCSVYGISQNPDTKDYIMVLDIKYFEYYCKKCDKVYTKRKWCKQCQINSFKENFANWTSKSDKIDKYIQEMQLNIIDYKSIIFEWIPYNHFNNIKEVGRNEITTVYSALWMNGPLNWLDKIYTRNSNYKKVGLKCLRNSHNNIDGFLKEISKWNNHLERYIYGISQNPDTKDYIVLIDIEHYCMKCDKVYTNRGRKWCKQCQINNFKENFANWTSKSDKIDNFIQEMQLIINDFQNVILEWIPYNQFYDIKEINKCDSATIYSASWKNGPLYWARWNNEYARYPHENIVLKCLHTSYNNITIEFLNEVHKAIKYPITYGRLMYGISQNPNSEEYTLILNNKYLQYLEKCCLKCDKIDVIIQHKLCRKCQINYLRENFANWISGNEKIDNYIQEMQLKVYSHKDTLFEWIPYNQFKDVKETSKDDFAIVYSAIWMDGPIFYNQNERKNLNKLVSLIGLSNSKNITNEFLIIEIQNYSKENYKTNTLQIYGISQNLVTEDYIMVLDYTYFEYYCMKCNKKYTNTEYKWCKSCQINDLKKSFTNWTSGDEKVDDFIQEMQLEVCDYKSILFEWISYNHFKNIKEVCKGNLAIVYSAVWENGPIFYKNERRNLNKLVALLSLSNSKYITDEFLKKIRNYLKENCHTNKSNNTLKIYGISQNSVTKDYIMVLDHTYFEFYCVKCNKKYPNIEEYKWCKSCEINDLKKKFTNWSGNMNVDSLIQEMQLNINNHKSILFEWIPYNQFKRVNEIDKGGFSTVYSAIWVNGPKYYNQNKKENSDKLVALKSLNNSQNITNECLKEVQYYSRDTSKSSNILRVYGMSQDPSTNNYIMVFEYATGGNINNYWIKKNYKIFKWKYKIQTLCDIIKGLKEIHQKHMVHCDFHTGNILYNTLRNKTYISDMGLCGEIGNIDETKIYGVMPYVAPEVLRGKPYTQAADIYSFGMIMYFTATGRQPFDNCAHDHQLALDICNGIRPEINDPEAPKCYISLMKRCWDSNPDIRPTVIELEKLINSYKYVIETKFKEAEEYRKKILLSFENNLSATHSQAIYTSRLLNPFTKDLPKYIDDSELSSKITTYNNEDNDDNYNNMSDSLEKCKIDEN